MKKIILIFSLIMLATVSSNASNKYGSSNGDLRKVGAAGVQFLKIGVGARANALAGAYGVLGNDLSSIHWNPAGVADVKNMTGEFSYTQWLFDFSHNFAALSMPLNDNFTLAAHLVSLQSSNISITTIDKPEGTGVEYTASDVSAGLTFSGYLTDQFSFGLTAKYVNNAFADMSAGGFAFDVGTLYKTGIQGITLGFSIHNLGTEQKYAGQGLRTTNKLDDGLNAAPIIAEYISYQHNLPIIFRAGIAGEVYRDDQHLVNGAIDFTTLSDTPEQFAIGAEYVWKGMFAIRGGYRFGQDVFGISGGVGFNYLTDEFMGRLDYSIAPTSDIGYVNRLTVAVGLGK